LIAISSIENIFAPLSAIFFISLHLSTFSVYVPDVSKWIDFYKNSYLQNKKRNNQFGGSIVGGVKMSIIPIENKKKIREPERKEINDVPIKIKSPVV
jgi:hypothetical protein